MASGYVSVFRLDGEPIMPPLMHPDRRKEMRHLRDLAIKVEQRIKENQGLTTMNDQIDSHIPEAPLESQENHIILPEVDCDETATSETLATDIYCPPAEQMEDLRTTSEMVSPSHSSKENQPEDFPTPKLIRSNSYTLDRPSPLLLKFLDEAQCQIKRMNKTICSTPKSPAHRKKTPRKLSEPAKLKKIYGLKTSPCRKSKSETLDDTKKRLRIHSRGEKVEKFFMKSKSVKDFENLTRKPNDLSRSDSSPEKESTPREDNNRAEDESLQIVNPETTEDQKRQQRNEQELLLEELRAKRQNQMLLINKLEELNLVDRTSTPVPQQITSSEEMQSEPDPQLNDTSFYSTIRGESPTYSMSLVSDAYSKQYLQSIRSFTASPSTRQQENIEIAATIINSHVRGYLVRRLLRTEFVQNIIDNIRNILFLILDSNPKDLQLKRSYLIKLNSNCEKLHDVFFKFSIKERMEVICKDRELLLQRLSQRRQKRSLLKSTATA